MGLSYQAVGWNRQKRVYDLVLAGGIALYLLLFIGMGAATDPNRTAESLLIRAFGSGAFLLLHVILCIGPLCRLDSRFLPLLYNRRHLGVSMFMMALVHGVLSIAIFHSLGDTNPFVSVLVSNPRLDSLSHFPFQPLGVAALFILFLMAATSHDFWLSNLTAPVWKTLHMLVYAAWALVVMHVVLGVLQAETSPLLGALVGAGALTVIGLHVVAGMRGSAIDVELPPAAWVDVCAVDDIAPDRAKMACIGAERVAVFRYDDKLSAVSSVCQHQNGPLGEGRVIDGCITCPWHGYQYEPETGASPAPFHERVPTFRVKVEGDRVLVDPTPLPAGTRVEPARLLTSPESSA